jgi:hypothetical protein
MEINEQVLASIVTAIKQAVQPSPQPPARPSRNDREEAIRGKVIELLKTSTQAEVAKFLDISSSMVSCIKNGYPIGRGSIARIEAAIKNEPLPTRQPSLSSSEVEQYETKVAETKAPAQAPKPEVKLEQPRVAPTAQAVGLERVLMRGYSDKRHTSKDVERLRRFSELLNLRVPSTDVVEIVSMLLDAVHAADTYEPQAVIYELAKQAYIAG